VVLTAVLMCLALLIMPVVCALHRLLHSSSVSSTAHLHAVCFLLLVFICTIAGPALALAAHALQQQQQL
jgi:hypothetical protein